MTQENFFPWDDIPDRDVLPDGDYHVKGVSLEDGRSNTGKRMFKAQIEVEEPQLYASMALFENYVTGSDEAPEAILPGSIGTRRLKQNLAAAQVPASNNIEALCAGFANTLFGVTVVVTSDKEGEYKGIERNRIVQFWKRGERTPGVKAGGSGGKGPAQAAAAAAGAGAQGTAAPPPPAAEMAAPTPPAAPPVAAAPPVVKAAAPPPEQTPVQAGAQNMMVCPMCDTAVETALFAAHVAECSKTQGEAT